MLSSPTPALREVAERPGPAPHFCRLVIYRDYEVPGAWYYAQLTLAPDCPPAGLARVRRTSTLNTHAAGSPVQPIEPQSGAWTVTALGDDVPNGKQFTPITSTWRWEWWNGHAWVAAEVL